MRRTIDDVADGDSNDYATPVAVVQGMRACRDATCGRMTKLAILGNHAGMCIGCYERYLRRPLLEVTGPTTYLARQIKAGVTGRLRGISSLVKTEAGGVGVVIATHDEVDEDARLADLKREAAKKADAYARAHGIVL